MLSDLTSEFRGFATCNRPRAQFDDATERMSLIDYSIVRCANIALVESDVEIYYVPCLMMIL